MPQVENWGWALLQLGELSQALQVMFSVGSKVLIDAALQMDGQMGDAENGPFHAHQSLLQAPRVRLLKYQQDC